VVSAACDAQAEGQTGMGQRKIWVPARFLGVSGSQAEDETRKGSSSTTKQGLARDLFLLDFWDVTIFNKNKLASNCLEKFFFWTLTFEDLILQQVDVFLYHLTRRTIFVFLFSFYFVVFHSRSGHVESIFEAKAGWGISSAPAFQGIPCRCLPFIFS